MKLKSISISNVLSFGVLQPSQQMPGIEFDEQLNILVGPNGVGKSNFLEVVNHVFQQLLFKIYTLNEFVLTQPASDTDRPIHLKKAIEPGQNSQSFHLTPNDDAQKQPSRIRLTITFNDLDRENFLFVFQNAASINSLIVKYSNQSIQIPTNFHPDTLVNIKEYSLTFLREYGSNFAPGLDNSHGLGNPNFLLLFLQHREMINHVIYLANRYEDLDWPPLKETFGLIPSHRIYNQISPHVTIGNEQNGTLSQSIKNFRTQTANSLVEGEPPIFDLTKRRIAQEYSRLIDEHGKEKANQLIQDYPILKSLNNLLMRNPLKFKLRINRRSHQTLDYELNFEDMVTHREVFVNRLSTGQKNVVYLIFSLFGSDLTNGMLLIDEPELHLHLQSQQEFLETIREISRDLNIQIILVSHSPAFINARDLQHIFRFYVQDGATHVVNPKLVAGDKNLWQIINLSNAARIFFSRGIILVEGETDEYFYRFLLTDLAGRDQAVPGLEIINIQGKGRFRLWKEFLAKFGIRTAFIGDWDNVVNFDIVTNQQVRQYTVNARVQLRQLEGGLTVKGNKDQDALLDLINLVLKAPNSTNLAALTHFRDHLFQRYLPYGKILQYLRCEQPAEFERISQRITDLRTEYVYLLPNGELEDYLDIGKGMKAMIEFVLTGFQT